MLDDSDILDLHRHPHLQGIASRAGKDKDREKEASDEESCSAFGFLRGLHDRALAVEFRFRNGNKEWWSYNLLGMWRHDPSVGILLKFIGGDLVTLVLIRGSNLGAQLNQHSVNLTDRGLQRHRVIYVREMDEDELRKATPGEPTIDHIEIGEFETVEEQHAWLKKIAPAFMRPAIS